MVFGAGNDETIPLIPAAQVQRSKLIEDHGPGEPPTGACRFGLSAFITDLQDVQGGTVPVSVAIALTIGAVCGLVAYVYYTVLEFLLRLVWKTIPEKCFLANESWPTPLHWLWIPIVCISMAFLVGISVRYLGDPGDLAYTVACVHKKAYVAVSHVIPMLFASQFSIIGGGSLGPEAPLVAICASVAGWCSTVIFGQRYKNVVRKHTLCGMACALAAFFGDPLGGSLFALEVNSRMGYEYFEHALEAILSGTTCLVVFRALAGLSVGPIWTISGDNLEPSSSVIVLLGATIGLLGASIAFCFVQTHKCIMQCFRNANLISRPIIRAVVGGVGISIIGVFIPHTLFWGEFEFQTLSRASPSSTLPHVWPTTGIFKYEITDFWTSAFAGVAKLLAISLTVACGYRGGYIFPFFASGAAFGRALVYLFPSLPPAIAALCFAAGINVAITRTALATTCILVFLSGEVNAAPPVLAAALMSLFVTSYMVCISVCFNIRFHRCKLSELFCCRFCCSTDINVTLFILSFHAWHMHSHSSQLSNLVKILKTHSCILTLANSRRMRKKQTVQSRSMAANHIIRFQARSTCLKP